MPIDLSNLSADDIATATTAVKAAREAREERERREVEEQRKRQEEEHAHQEATMRREVEERKAAAARKAEAEQRDCLAREKAAREEVVVEEQRQSLATGLSGLKLTIPAPASIARTASGSSTQSKGKRKAADEELFTSQCIAFISFSFLADFLWRSRFPSCHSCTIIGIPCLTELQKNGMRRTSCDQCRQLKKACHWDLVGITGPRDPNAPKWAHKTVKKPVIDVDDFEDDGDGTVPSPAMDLAASAFAIRNAANALVTESASIRGTFIRFHEHIAMSLDRMTEVLVKEQVAAQRDRFASFKLLERIAEALERSSPRQAGVVLAEGPAAGGTEVVPAVIADVERVRTPLFLMDSDPPVLPFALEAGKDSEEELGSSSGSEGSDDEENDDGSFGAMDGDAMVE
jgi:flagellar biosynthesis GTPase FlhF